MLRRARHWVVAVLNRIEQDGSMAGVVVEFSDDVQARLDKLSAQTGRPTADYVRELVDEHLAELEWVQELDARAEAIRAGLIETQPFDELMHELGFDPEELRAEGEAEIKAEIEAKTARKTQAA